MRRKVLRTKCHATLTSPQCSSKSQPAGQILANRLSELEHRGVAFQKSIFDSFRTTVAGNPTELPIPVRDPENSCGRDILRVRRPGIQRRREA